MNTENPATPPEATPAPNIHAVDFTSESKQLHRKIAKLPKPLRDIINTSLDDGLPAKEIIQKLEASTNPPLPYPISAANISGWKTTGYMRYLAQLDHLDSIQASREAALEMVAANNLSLPQATLQVIASQCFEVLADFSPAAIKQKLAEDPLKYTSFLHVFARLTREMVHLEKYQDAKAAAQAQKSDPNRDPEEEAAQFWNRHTKSLFNRKDPNRIKTENSKGPPNNPEGIATSSPGLPALRSAFDEGGRGYPGIEASNIHNPERVAPTPHESDSPPTQNPKSKFENPPLPAATASKILEEHCLECHQPLPPLTPEGKRPNARCEHCNILLPPPGTCARPSSDKCHFCGVTLPHRLPNGRRPVPACHVCGCGLGRELDEDIQKYAEE